MPAAAPTARIAKTATGVGSGPTRAAPADAVRPRAPRRTSSANAAERWRASCADHHPAPSAAPGTWASRWRRDARGRLAHHDAVHARRARRPSCPAGPAVPNARRPAKRSARARPVAGGEELPRARRASRGRGRRAIQSRARSRRPGSTRRHGRRRPPRAAGRPASATDALPVASTSAWSSALAGHAGGEVGDQGHAEDLGAQVAGGDGLEDGRHAHQVRPQRAAASRISAGVS